MIIKASTMLDEVIALQTDKGHICYDTELLDEVNLAKPFLMLVTGLPSSGKSEVVDAIALNMAIKHNWKWIFFTPENYPLQQHIKKHIERINGKPLKLQTSDEIKKATEFIDYYFTWILPPEDEITTLKDIRKYTEDYLLKGNQLDAIVIDPWNELNHSKIQGGMRDDQYISEVLTQQRKWHRKLNLLTCIVIHPHSMHKGADGKIPIVSVRDCNGGAMWANKADYAISVHRPDITVNSVEVYTQKVKYKWMGKPAMTKLDYDYPTGRFKRDYDYTYELPKQEMI